MRKGLICFSACLLGLCVAAAWNYAADAETAYALYWIALATINGNTLRIAIRGY
jgi:hypothetical protein